MFKKEKRIPTIFGLLIVFLGIGATAFLVEHFEGLRTQALPSLVPQEVKITNLGSSGFTVSWLTNEKTQGSVVFGQENSLGKSAYDERDDEKNLEKYLTHHVSIKALEPASTYYFKIVSGSKSFDQNGLPYEIKTTPAFTSPSSQVEPAYGTVLDKDNNPAQDTIVYLTFKGALPLSVLTKPSGNFLIPLNLAARSDFKGYYAPQDGEEEEILVVATIDKTATVVTDTKNDSPIPTIVLGKSYDFRTEKENSLAKKVSSPKVLGTKSPVSKVEILFPKEDMPLLDSRPLFKGRGVPRNEVIIEIESPLLVEKIAVDPNGQWSFRPKEPLPPGKHTITITTQDEKGQETTLSRSFLVLKSGSQVLGEATPSATLTPTLAPTATPQPTATPTLSTPAPTSTPTPAPETLSPSPTLTPGIFALTINLVLLGTLFVLVGTGAVFLF